MKTRITFVFETPIDHRDFAARNPHLMATARAISGFQRIETSQGLPTALATLLWRSAVDRPARATVKGRVHDLPRS